ncbi:MAG: class I SAM-dependent methyltransferase [Oligoflexales bacterium]|nr:class I SAM-dependent methyltransferase [Oligoflexales bacterium]
MASKKLAPFDKYFYYRNSVQSPDIDVVFFDKVYRDLNKKKPHIFREDFCGTFALSCEWVKLNSENISIGNDLDSEPINYGKKNYLSKLTPEQQSRVNIKKKNVLNPGLDSADIICALNFSYFIFKERELLKKYFANCLKKLKPKGLFLIDVFGGSACMEPIEEETEHDDMGFSYYWDQDSYNPINHHAQFYIHFKRYGEKKREKVFSYDWRMWSIPELRDILSEVGFSNTIVYWEGTDKKGEGNGIFKRSETGEICEGWIAYIVAQR